MSLSDEEIARAAMQAGVPPPTPEELARRSIEASEHDGGEPPHGREEPPPADPGDPGPAAHDAIITGDALVLSASAPLKSARAFVGSNFTAPQGRLLHYWNGTFHAWDGAAYPEAADADLRARLYDFLDAARVADKDGKLRPFNPNRTKIGDVLDATRAVANLPASFRPPCWIGQAPDLPAEEIIACSNGLLHLPTGELLPHTPEYFTLNALDFPYDRSAAQPSEWLRFLAALWPDDVEAVETLQEAFGYLLTADTRQQKMFLIVGPKRSGKGTIARVLTALVGQANVVGPTLNGLAQNFGLAPLIGKRVAIISDARLGGRSDPQAIAERLLAISGEDGLTIDRKNRDHWTGQLQVRFVILSNELPRLTDASGALASRFMVLTMRRSFYGSEDQGLTDRLLRELPSILNWSIAGWRRLQARGYFRQPESAAGAVRELEDLSSPINAFLRDRCTIAAGRQVEVNRMFAAWKAWCEAQGRDQVGTMQWFGRDLRTAVPGLDISQPTGSDGKRYRVYEGVGLND